MDIIIAGAGTVGFKLAQTLSQKHNIVLIDQNRQTLQTIANMLDIMTIEGHIEDPDIYKPFVGQEYDIFIAVTDSDEANILSTLIVDDIIDVEKKIIRLRNPYFAKSSIASRLGITEAIFPFSFSAKAIFELLDFPKANNVKSFEPFFNAKLISVQSEIEEELDIEQIKSQFAIVAGIEREKNFFIPKGNEKIKKNDLIYLFGRSKDLKQLCKKLNTTAPEEIEKVAIFGAGVLGIELAKLFIKKDLSVKIIDESERRCKKAALELLNDATIINSRFHERTIYEEEQLSNADMVIATSDNDEDNIIRCLEAKEYGIKKSVAINNNVDFYDLMHKLGIVAVRGPKMTTFYKILETILSNDYIQEKQFCGGRGTILMRKIKEQSKILEKEIKAINDENILSLLIRNEQIFFLDHIQKTKLQANDTIVLFLPTKLEEQAKRWIEDL